MAWFKLLIGTHIQGDLSVRPDARGAYPERVYRAGEVFESDVDLRALNGNGMSPKFERVDMEGPPVGSVSPPKPPAPAPAEPTKAPEATKAFEATKAPEAPAGKRDLDRDYGSLDKMSLNELREVAESEEIDLKGASKKEDIVKILRGT